MESEPGVLDEGEDTNGFSVSLLLSENVVLCKLSVILTVFLYEKCCFFSSF